MNFSMWNLRNIPIFKEEIRDGNDDELSYPSVKIFQGQDMYDIQTRRKISEYIKNGTPIVSTTMYRVNIYDNSCVSELTYYTDGEVIYNNTLMEYINYENFILPIKWFDLIVKKNFINSNIKLDYQKIISGEIDIFSNTQKGFEELFIM